MEGKVVRMLKAALFPHINDYRLEIRYEKSEDDFEIVEKVTDSLKLKLDGNDDETQVRSSPKGEEQSANGTPETQKDHLAVQQVDRPRRCHSADRASGAKS